MMQDILDGGHQPGGPNLLFDNFCQKLHENEKNLTWVPVPPWIRQCKNTF